MPKHWSTKNLHIITPPSAETTGIGVFEFTDDYSVFHFGKMPDQIEGKGEAICRMAAMNFRLFEERGIETHFRKFIAPNRIEFRLLRVIDPLQQPISEGERNYFIPLQVVFRNSLPPGSSVFRRIQRGTATLARFGWSSLPEPGMVLDSPVIEFMTKLEEIDRFIDEPEAMRLAGLSEKQLAALKDLVLAVNDVISRKAASAGLHHADGKLEFGISDRGTIFLVDAAGTPDENRFTLEGFDISKQIMRNYYAPTGLELKIQQWAAAGVPRSLWEQPEPLPPEFLVPVSQLYKSLCETWIGERIWGAPPLSEVVRVLATLGMQARQPWPPGLPPHSARKVNDQAKSGDHNAS
jgi:phosphoribosylaminoimidazole-succinocarboxamide synthase